MITAEVDYPLLNLFWTTFLIFGWVLWIDDLSTGPAL